MIESPQFSSGRSIYTFCRAISDKYWLLRSRKRATPLQFPELNYRNCPITTVELNSITIFVTLKTFRLRDNFFRWTKGSNKQKICSTTTTPDRKKCGWNKYVFIGLIFFF